MLIASLFVTKVFVLLVLQPNVYIDIAKDAKKKKNAIMSIIIFNLKLHMHYNQTIMILQSKYIHDSKLFQSKCFPKQRTVNSDKFIYSFLCFFLNFASLPTREKLFSCVLVLPNKIQQQWKNRIISSRSAASLFAGPRMAVPKGG